MRCGKRRYIEILPFWCFVDPHSVLSIQDVDFSVEQLLLFLHLNRASDATVKVIRSVGRLATVNVGSSRNDFVGGCSP